MSASEKKIGKNDKEEKKEYFMLVFTILSCKRMHYKIQKKYCISIATKELFGASMLLGKERTESQKRKLLLRQIIKKSRKKELLTAS